MENHNNLSKSADNSSTEKTGQKTKLAGVLNVILTFILILIGIAAVGLFVGFIAIMINPKLETFNSYDDFRLLYEFSPIDREQNFEVVSSHAALTNSEVKLLASINFQIASRKFVVTFFFFYFVILGWFVNILFQLRNFLRTFNTGNPFIRKNVQRIRIIGWFVILFPFLGIIFMLAMAPYFKNIIVNPATPVSFYWRSFLEYGKDSLWAIIFGLVVLVIAESFRIATQIKEEQELTI